MIAKNKIAYDSSLAETDIHPVPLQALRWSLDSPLADDQVHLCFQMLELVAWKLAGHKPRKRKVRVSALLITRNDFMIIGYNQYRETPLQHKYRKNIHAIYLHAEIDAIEKTITHNLDIRESILFVCRVKYDPEDSSKKLWGLARPCSGCLRAIRDFNISRVYFTLDEYLSGSRGWDVLDNGKNGS